MGETVAIIPARGGSKGVVGKNIRPICGRPLVAWSVLQAFASPLVSSVWVTSDSPDILEAATQHGAHAIQRPDDLSGDLASSESAWIHAVDTIESQGIDVDWVVGMQATSPIRETSDIDQAIQKVVDDDLDSLLTVTEVEDYFTWSDDPDGPESISYDYRNRKRRQATEKRYLENGSFYVFSPELLRRDSNRLGGKIGLHVMERYKMFQIDTEEDFLLCQSIMQGFGLGKIDV